MSRRQALMRALSWTVLTVGLLFGLLSLPAVANQWEGDEPTTRGTTTTPPTTDAPATSPTIAEPATTAPTTQAPLTTLPLITVGPPITVAPVVTASPATTALALSETTTSAPATTTTRPELLVPARPSATTTTTSTTLPEAADEGLSADTKLALAVGGLLLAAVVIGALTVVYFVKTRPGAVEVGGGTVVDGDAGSLTDDDETVWEPRPAGASGEDPTLATGVPVAASEDVTDDGDEGGRAALARLLADAEDDPEPAPPAGPATPLAGGENDEPPPAPRRK